MLLQWPESLREYLVDLLLAHLQPWIAQSLFSLVRVLKRMPQEVVKVRAAKAVEPPSALALPN
jgi:hypothetical protein